MSAPIQDHPTTAGQLRERLLDAAPLTERHERLAGISTAILEGGEGPPMVLLHGPGEFWGVWLNVIRDLVHTHRIIAVDLPGHGASLEFEGKLDAGQMVTWVDELIDLTCAAPPVLAGHLLGGAIAARYAVEHSDRLAHLVLVDTMGLNWYRPSPRFAIPMVKFIAKPTAERRDRFFEECFVDFDRVGDNFGDIWDTVRDYALTYSTTPENQAAMKAMMPRLGVPPISTNDRDQITVPTILIHGRHDLQVPLRAAEKASRRHGWPLYVVEGARDDPAAEQPEEFVRVLRQALTNEAGATPR